MDEISPNQQPVGAALRETRGYQAEMLTQSLQRNIIIALDTGAGKTHIAVLRLKHEMEKEIIKRSWFIAPTVALCVQQHSVLEKYISLSIGIISSSNEPDQWKNEVLWQNFLRTHQIIVSTPQVLLDALRHGYIVMGRDISLIVFDEAHHTKDNNPYNRIMQEFYFELPPRQGTNSNGMVRPMILGLTASPVYGGKVEKDLRTIEKNLDCTICTPRLNRVELSQYVHRPTFRHVAYQPSNGLPSTNLASLQVVKRNLNIDHDPFVVDLRNQLAKSTPGSTLYRKIDQKLSRVIDKKDSFTHKGLQDFINAANAIHFDVGEWAADWFVCKVIEHARKAANPQNNVMVSWRDSERAYLLRALDEVVLTPALYCPDDIDQGCTSKVNVLVECLLAEVAEAQSLNEEYSGIIFVERRDTVLALAEVLKHHPRLKTVQLRVGMLLGTSDSSRRHSMMDITRNIVKESQDDTLEAFRDGNMNLIVSTAVAEEGIDIQACGSVIRWDPPQNMKSWLQSRGRARKQRSTFTVMHEEGGKSATAKWMEEERQMLEFISQSRHAESLEDDLVNGEDDDEDDDLMFEIPSTGAKLTLHSAISHLTHFCATIPNSTHADNRPLFERDPPEYPVGWHSSMDRSLAVDEGPYGSTVTLPRALPLPQRQFHVEREFKTAISAHRHAAFIAYKELYERGLLNENLLPIPSVIDPTLEVEVKEMLANIQKRETLANATIGVDPWYPDDEESNTWLLSELTIEGLHPLFLLTRSETIPFEIDQGPVIHPPGRAPMRTSLRPLAEISADHPKVALAREFTRRVFWGLNASRMDWDNLNFAYLFLPVQESSYDHIWDSRRAWLEGECKANAELFPDRLIVKADRFVKTFGSVEDLTLVRRHAGSGRPWIFSGWRHEELTSDEDEKLRHRYGRLLDNIAITYPLMTARSGVPRTNMLLPNLRVGNEMYGDIPTQLLIPEHTPIALLSDEETEYASLLPSVLRALSSLMTANSLRKTLFSSTPLQEIPLPLLKVAITAPSSNDGVNYQRLETLGDAVLKLVVGVQLLAEYPLWHEGYLASKKDHAVANIRLAKENINRRFYRWLIRDAMLGRKWTPRYFSQSDVFDPEFDEQGLTNVEATCTTTDLSSPSGNANTTEESDRPQTQKKRKSKGNQLSIKILADVVESIIGAAYLHGDLPLGYECVKYFDLGLEWKPPSTRMNQILARADALTSGTPFPPHLEDVERMLGYTFNRKVLLVEALTHASYQEDSHRTTSYERMGFLGDSILDLIVNDHLYRVPRKNYSPGHIYLRKIAVVNMHLLAYLCLNMRLKKRAITPRPNRITGVIEESTEEHEINLFSCLLHSSTRLLADQMNTYSRYKRLRNEIDHALTEGNTYPWAALASLQAPEIFSDIMESLIGAVYLDSRGDMAITRNVMKEMGIMRVLEHIVMDDVDVLHPISRLSRWAQKAGKELDFRTGRKAGNVICQVFIGGTELECARATSAYRGKASEEEVKFAAAEAATKHVKLRDVGVRYDTLKKKKKKKKKRGEEKL